MTPISLPTLHTRSWFLEQLPKPAGGWPRLLEIGCGQGDLAAALAADGLTVVALDHAPEAVDAARSKGVDAHACAWPALPAEASAKAPYDAVAFTRSLHHMALLSAAVAKAAEVAADSGLLLLDEFASEVPDADTLGWWRTVLARHVERCGPLPPEGQQARLLAAADADAAVRVWRAHHEQHGVHRWESVRATAQVYFTPLAETAEPYLYRSLIPALPADAAAADWLGGVYREEAAAIAAGSIRAVGRYWAGRRR